MAEEPKKPYKFIPAPNNIRVNSIKELRGMLDFDSLPPASKLAIKSALKEYLDYLSTLPQFSSLRQQRGNGSGDSAGTDDAASSD